MYPTALIFDTETTGLPPRANDPTRRFAHYRKWGDNARLVQIAWQICGPQGQVLERYCTIIRPDGFVIPLEASNVHGISQDNAMNEGIPIDEVLEKLFRSIETFEVERMVAHNCQFDYHVIASELYKLQWKKEMECWKKLPSFCTMLRGTPQRERFMKLSVMYEKLIGTMDDSIRLHQADSDVELCVALFHHLWPKRQLTVT
jgi:DNA polymerase-3 subunit alpha